VGVFSLGKYDVIDELTKKFSGPYNGVTDDLRTTLFSLSQHYDLGIVDINDKAHTLGSTFNGYTVTAADPHLEGRAADIAKVNGAFASSIYVEPPKAWVDFTTYALQNNSNVTVGTYQKLIDAVEARDSSLSSRLVLDNGTGPHIHLEVATGSDTASMDPSTPGFWKSLNPFDKRAWSPLWGGGGYTKEGTPATPPPGGGSILDASFWVNFGIASALVALGIAFVTGGFVWLAAPEIKNVSTTVAKNPEAIAA
jgi:hypothetical protein